MSDWFPPVDDQFGQDCLRCADAGENYLRYYIQFQDIKRGNVWAAWMGQPPNHLYVITQRFFFPCEWETVLGVGNLCRWKCAAAQTTLLFDLSPVIRYFWSDVPADCRRFHFNSFNNPAAGPFYDGFAMIFTPSEIQAIIETVTPVVDPDPLMRCSPTSDGKLWISYIDEWGDTKFKMKVDSY